MSIKKLVIATALTGGVSAAIAGFGVNIAQAQPGYCPPGQTCNGPGGPGPGVRTMGLRAGLRAARMARRVARIGTRRAARHLVTPGTTETGTRRVDRATMTTTIGTPARTAPVTATTGTLARVTGTPGPVTRARVTGTGAALRRRGATAPRRGAGDRHPGR